MRGDVVSDGTLVESTGYAAQMRRPALPVQLIEQQEQAILSSTEGRGVVHKEYWPFLDSCHGKTQRAQYNLVYKAKKSEAHLLCLKAI